MFGDSAFLELAKLWPNKSFGHIVIISVTKIPTTTFNMTVLPLPLQRLVMQCLCLFVTWAELIHPIVIFGRVEHDSTYVQTLLCGNKNPLWTDLPAVAVSNIHILSTGD
jgi:hypothetical protein